MNDIQFCEAQKGDLKYIVQMLADDPLGIKRERFESSTFFILFQRIRFH